MGSQLLPAFAKGALALALAVAPAAAQSGAGMTMGGAAGSGTYQDHYTPDQRKRLQERANAVYRALADSTKGVEEVRGVMEINEWGDVSSYRPILRKRGRKFLQIAKRHRIAKT